MTNAAKRKNWPLLRSAIFDLDFSLNEGYFESIQLWKEYIVGNQPVKHSACV